MNEFMLHALPFMGLDMPRFMNGGSAKWWTKRSMTRSRLKVRRAKAITKMRKRNK